LTRRTFAKNTTGQKLQHFGPKSSFPKKSPDESFEKILFPLEYVNTIQNTPKERRINPNGPTEQNRQKNPNETKVYKNDS
jgi:hypothetical protein